MLVLTRRTNQSIVVGRDIVVTVLEVRGDQVRLGIRAPKEVSVYREEVLSELRRQNRAAASANAADLRLLPSAIAGGPGSQS